MSGDNIIHGLMEAVVMANASTINPDLVEVVAKAVRDADVDLRRVRDRGEPVRFWSPAVAQAALTALQAAGYVVVKAPPVCEPMDPDEYGWSEWVHPLPGYLMQCCDCGLVHDMEFAIGQTTSAPEALNDGEDDDAVILFRARRHDPDRASNEGPHAK